MYFFVGATTYTEKQNMGNHINETQFGEIFTLNIVNYDSKKHSNGDFPHHILGYGRPFIKNSKEKIPLFSFGEKNPLSW